MKKNYFPNEIELLVQAHWEKNQTFTVTEDKNKEKYYCLSMLPYPSGQLHIGHVRNYTIGDVISRYQRLLGKNVLQPIGWDAFGLPAEQAAILNNSEPSSWTYKNIQDMKHQLKLLGFAYDWTREIITCQPKYYKWEQWFFTILYKKKLVYKKTALVNWCSYHHTVLANEQIINGRCWRCNNLIVLKNIPQWFIKITKYADQLLNDLDKLKYWPDKVKNMQRNWIGRSDGLDIFFKISEGNKILKTYSTRLDFFMGITYISITPDHYIAQKLAQKNLCIFNFIQKYNFAIFLNKNKNFSFEKKGIFTNIYAIHPITNKKLPIWITNFISVDFNNVQAMLGVPAHNQLDYEFAKKYKIPIKAVIQNSDNTSLYIVLKQAMTKKGILFNSENFNGLNSDQAQSIIENILIKKGLAKKTKYFRLKDWGISRQRYWGTPIPMLTLKSGQIVPVPKHELPIVFPTYKIIKKNKKKYSFHIPNTWINTVYNGQHAIRETDTFDTFMESSWYYARYTSPQYDHGMLNSFSANYWLPIDQYVGGIEHAIMHLMYFRFYHKLMRDFGLVKSDEPAKRLLCQGMVLSDSFYYITNDGKKIWVSPANVKTKRNKTGNIIQAIDSSGHKLIHAGMCKMSKSKNNGINPIQIIEKYGADTIRFFIMFAAPVDSELEWNESGLIGAYRFLNRLWILVHNFVNSSTIKFLKNYTLNNTNLNNKQKSLRFQVHQTIIKVTNNINNRQTFNTALADIMKLVNKLYKTPYQETYDKVVFYEALLVIVRLLYPFVPHITFFLWKSLENSKDIDYASWPIPDSKTIVNDNITLIIIQINGKTRHKIFVPKNSKKNIVCQIALKEPRIKKYFSDKSIYKTIFIHNKIINFLVK